MITYNDLFNRIAQRTFFCDNLNVDNAQHEICVSSLTAALDAAYKAGRTDGASPTYNYHLKAQREAHIDDIATLALADGNILHVDDIEAAFKYAHQKGKKAAAISPRHLKTIPPSAAQEEILHPFFDELARDILAIDVLETHTDTEAQSAESDYYTIELEPLKKALGIIYDNACQKVMPLALFEELAKTHLAIPTLERRMMDALDCYDLTSLSLKRILTLAFEAGQQHADLAEKARRSAKKNQRFAKAQNLPHSLH